MNGLRRFHQNTGGAISILVLLTIWCLVALVAMVWNTGEYAMRRRHIQNAADSDAHAAATWMARTTNQITMQNMVIAQNGATEVIARSLAQTNTLIRNKINGETAAAEGVPAQYRQLVSLLPGLLNNIKTQFSLVSTALNQIDADIQNGTLTFPNDKAAAAYTNKVRQARYSVNWIENNYIPQLDNLVQQLSNVKLTKAMILLLKEYIDRELAKLDEYWKQVGGIAESDLTVFTSNEGLIFEEEMNVKVSLLPDSPDDIIEKQRSSLAGFNKTNIIHTYVSAPVQSAGDVLGLDHPDSIREKHSDWFPPGLPLSVPIDPINPNTNPNPADPFDPNSSAVVYPKPDPLIIDGEQVTINWNVPGGWGHCWAFPIEHYFSDRVSKDMLGLQGHFFQNGSTDPEMEGIDDIRIELARVWNQMAGLDVQVPPIPSTVTDDQLNPDTGKDDLIPVFPSLSNSGGAGTNTDADFSYRRSIGQYKSSIQLLISRIQTFGAFLDAFTVPIAVPTWQSQIQANHRFVSQELGQNKEFMVLGSYKLYPIPDWAQPGLQESLTTAITWQIYNRNLQKLAPFGLNAIAAIRPWASEIADELVSRPWPYEKAPPDEEVPPTRGMGMQDRHDYFSVVSVASETDATGVRVLLPTIFGNNTTKLAAYSQAETFNWMEYNDSYGGYATEKFDEVSSNVFGTMLACPRAWRLSTVGGWNWQPRLSAADNLANAILGDSKSEVEIKQQPSPEIQSALDDAGIHIGSDNRGTLDLINLH